MSTALDHEIRAAAERQSSDVRPQGPRQREEPFAATAAVEWKRDHPEEHTLPTGNKALLQRPRTIQMMRNGEIPNPLLGAAAELTAGGIPSDMAQVADLMDVMVAAAFVSPKVAVEDPGPDELSIDDISELDKTYVLRWMQQGVAALATFRPLGEGPADGEGGGDLRDEAE